jgi:pimeloyl-[acyl-carrier protein] methyl ester esterase
MVLGVMFLGEAWPHALAMVGRGPGALGHRRLRVARVAAFAHADPVAGGAARMTGALHIEVVGHGPPLVLLHGWAMHGGVFRATDCAPARSFHLACLDLPGHGLSRACSVPLALEPCVQAIAAHVPRAPWCGWSLGGLVGAARCCDARRRGPRRSRCCAPARASCVAKIGNSVCRQKSSATSPTACAAITAPRSIASSPGSFGSDHAKDEIRALRDGLFSRGEPSAGVLADGLKLLETTDLRDTLPSLRVPSLWLAGRRDRLVDPRAMRDAAALAPRRHVARHRTRRPRAVPHACRCRGGTSKLRSRPSRMNPLFDPATSPRVLAFGAQLRRRRPALQHEVESAPASNRWITSTTRNSNCRSRGRPGSRRGPGPRERRDAQALAKARIVAVDLALRCCAKRQAEWFWRPFDRVDADVRRCPSHEGSVDVLFSNLCVQWSDLPAAFAGFLPRVETGGPAPGVDLRPRRFRIARMRSRTPMPRRHVSPSRHHRAVRRCPRACGFKNRCSIVVSTHALRNDLALPDARAARDRRHQRAADAPPHADGARAFRRRRAGLRCLPRRRRHACRHVGSHHGDGLGTRPGAPIREGGFEVTSVPISSIPVRRRPR